MALFSAAINWDNVIIRFISVFTYLDILSYV